MSEELISLWRQAKHVVILSGAGMSTESGLPDFRGPNGLWKGKAAIDLASINALLENPQEFYDFYRQRLLNLSQAKPNRGHDILARLEKQGHVKSVLTQNIDGLHQKAGSENVLELHGNLREAICIRCGRKESIDILEKENIPLCPVCQGYLKPGVVLFGESLPEQEFRQAVAESYRADLFIVLGSSLEVGPVNMLPKLAIETGSYLAIINMTATPLDSLAAVVLHERIGIVLGEVVEELEG